MINTIFSCKINVKKNIQVDICEDLLSDSDCTQDIEIIQVDQLKIN